MDGCVSHPTRRRAGPRPDGSSLSGRCRSSARHAERGRPTPAPSNDTSDRLGPSSTIRSSAAAAMMSRLHVAGARPASPLDRACDRSVREVRARRALGAVQHPELDAGLVGHAAHDAVQGVDLAHQVALAQPADGGVADISPMVSSLWVSSRVRTPGARGGSRRLAAGVTAADDNNIPGVGQRYAPQCERPRI
jgi:hypothetical protein